MWAKNSWFSSKFSWICEITAKLEQITARFEQKWTAEFNRRIVKFYQIIAEFEQN
jgi:hypothetical protein